MYHQWLLVIQAEYTFLFNTLSCSVTDFVLNSFLNTILKRFYYA